MSLSAKLDILQDLYNQILTALKDTNVSQKNNTTNKKVSAQEFYLVDFINHQSVYTSAFPSITIDNYSTEYDRLKVDKNFQQFLMNRYKNNKL